MFRKFLKSKDGTAAIEYGIIAALIGLAIVGSVTNLGQENAINYEGIQQDVDNAINNP